MSEETPAPDETTEVTAEDVAGETEATTESTPEAEAASPWQEDLSAFEDPAVREQVDSFMREKVQPYVSRLEQDSAPDRNASRLWQAFHDDPVATHEQVTKEIYGDDADRVLEALRNEEEGDTPPEADSPPEDPVDDSDTPDSISGLPDDVQEYIKDGMEAKREKEYLEVMDEVGKELVEDGVPFDRALFEPHLIASDGDLDAAKQGYTAWTAKAKETYGLNVPTEGLGKEAPPPTLGGTNTTGAPAPPTEKEYGSIGDALDDFFAEESSPPPTV